jgi:hypothetical protein
MRDIVSPLSGIRSPFSGRRAFSPLSLFASGEQGAWYDPSDLTTLFQDSAGLTPVTAVGQFVGRINDKSGRGNHATQATSGARPALQQEAGGQYYLAIDGTDDVLSSATHPQFVAPFDFFAAINITGGATIFTNIFSLSQIGGTLTADGTEGLFSRNDGATRSMAVGSRIGVGTPENAILSSAFVHGTPFVARGSGEVAQLRITTPAGGTATAAATYPGTPYSNVCRFNIGAAGSAVFRFYGGLAIDRLLTAAEAAQLTAFLNLKAGV